MAVSINGRGDSADDAVVSLDGSVGSLDDGVVSLGGCVGLVDDGVISLDGDVGSMDGGVVSLNVGVGSVDGTATSLDGRSKDGVTVFSPLDIDRLQPDTAMSRILLKINNDKINNLFSRSILPHTSVIARCK